MKKQGDLLTFTDEEMKDVNKLADRLWFELLGITRIDYSSPIDPISMEIIRKPKTILMQFRTWQRSIYDRQNLQIKNNTIDLNKVSKAIRIIQDSIDLCKQADIHNAKCKIEEEILKAKQTRMKIAIDSLIEVKEFEGSEIVKKIITKALNDAIDKEELVLDIA